ncbi:hypothetical protein CLPUN_38020 [Clostridium puniceum]|uniref:DUF5348 domain-containing protein n=1 Tax=Clostridium puniceum TaxID=29367 RepID=A0A1S8TAD7_9CLOT|nr:hypothetical protein [Clostridium puniceum]OOM74561.1 hypothetical protein CLPUN_38020 [Clostridium puniceum]
MIEIGAIFKNKGETWEVMRYDSYENKYICCNVNTESKGKFEEKEILVEED